MQIVANSRAMQHALTLLRCVAPHSISVLLLGETGTGKEVLARALHCSSGRRGPFVPVNCAAIPNGLFEGELFGATRGSYTGATTDRIGLVEAANGGTLFLDEVGELPPEAQAKMLRVLEEKAVRRIGDTKERPVDVRVVAASNRDLAERAATSVSFRPDLYYRLAGAVIQIPALRERKEDIPALIAAFLAEEGAPPMSNPDLDTFLHNPWRGNIRELRQAVQRYVVGCGAIGPVSRPRPSGAATQATDEEILLLVDELGANAAWRASGLSRTVFYERVRRARAVAEK